MSGWGTRTRAVDRARSYSKRHDCTMEVEHVVKGWGKGRYVARELGFINGWRKGTEVEIVATYTNGKKV